MSITEHDCNIFNSSMCTCQRSLFLEDAILVYLQFGAVVDESDVVPLRCGHLANRTRCNHLAAQLYTTYDR